MTFLGLKWPSNRARTDAQAAAEEIKIVEGSNQGAPQCQQDLPQHHPKEQRRVQEPTWAASSAEPRSPSFFLPLVCVLLRFSRGEELGVRRAAARTQDQKAQAQ